MMMKKNPPTTKCGKSEFHWGERTYIMGILNMSPESFSKDGLNNKQAALEQAQRIVSEGADIIDIGGESTKPGYIPISIDEELKRVIPVIEEITQKVQVPVSVDTTKYEVARRSLEAGATMLNDQWGLKKDPRLGALAVEYNVPIVLMSNQREIDSYDAKIERDSSSYTDVISEVMKSLQLSIEIATNLGVSSANIIIDPGIGFGKTWQQDIEIVRRLGELKTIGNPILLGPSRKSLIKMILQTPANDRIEGTEAVVAIGIANGADIVRVHDVKQIARVCKMSDAIVRGIL
jgi:dihydropteroate synthase